VNIHTILYTGQPISLWTLIFLLGPRLFYIQRRPS